MKAKLKAKWLKGLRSGRYKQGAFSFQHNDTYCCLGVLCVVSRRAPMINGGSNWDYVRSVINGPTYGANDHVMNAAHMNDDGKPFSEIADYIEANL